MYAWCSDAKKGDSHEAGCCGSTGCGASLTCTQLTAFVASSQEFIATPEHRDKADEDSNVGAIAGGASALVALIAVGAAIRMRRHRTLQASESANTDMHQNPGVEDANAVPAVADPANAI